MKPAAFLEQGLLAYSGNPRIANSEQGLPQERGSIGGPGSAFPWRRGNDMEPGYIEEQIAGE